MSFPTKIRRPVLFIALGALLGFTLHALLESAAPTAANAAGNPAKPAPTLQSLAAEIELLKGRAADQSHAMQDVAYHFSNLYFAGQKQNWDLAKFYFSETKSHLHWAVRIIPVRKDTAGQEIFLERILGAMENTPLKQLEGAIAAKDAKAFDAAYRFTMETCYACHKAVDKPFLHPHIPAQPESRIINFDVDPDWPK
jgi:hypothetical protein